MEWENKKRGREEEAGGGGGEKKEKFVKRSAAKKEERSGHVEVEADQSSHISSSDKYLGLGVFDFPWLHDDDDGGIISKSEQDWNLFQDTFSSLLHDIEFTTHCNLFETTDAAANTPTTTTTTMNINTNTNVNINIPDYKFEGAFPFQGEEEEEEEDDDDDLEIGNVDGSIWSSMFNQPLQHPHTLD
ncbi:hypothetical protein AB3S75_007881 [Citrus x aurantiifolia]